MEFKGCGDYSRRNELLRIDLDSTFGPCFYFFWTSYPNHRMSFCTKLSLQKLVVRPDLVYMNDHFRTSLGEHHCCYLWSVWIS